MRHGLRAFAFLAAISAGVIGFTLSAHSQQRGAAPRGQAPGAAPRGQAPATPAAANQSPRGPREGTENGWSTFQLRCSRCHLDPVADLAPQGVAIRQMTPERIFESLTTASIKAHAGLAEPPISDAIKRRVAEFMAGRPMGSSKAGPASLMPNKCASNPAMGDPAKGPGWNGWGNDDANTRFQPASAARLTAAQVPLLKLKWSFGFPTGETSSSQPTVLAGRVFVASDNGFVYSLDANTGCVYWSFEGGSIVRGSVAVGPVTGQGNARYAVFFGDGHANIFGVNAQDGRMLWKTKVDSHVVARITAGTRYYNGKLLVPVSSSEEFSSGTADYPCCTSRGSMVALDANTGKMIWKAWVVEGEVRAWKIQSNGVVLYRPGGGGVWNAPTIDPVRNAVYFSTGDATTPPAPKTTDGVMAVDLDTGKLLWSYVADENDVFMGGCRGANISEACPNPNGPDLDIGNSPILKALPNGKRVLLVGTKRGHVIGLDPDNNGAQLYRVLASTGLPPAPAAPGARGPGGPGGGGGGGTIVWGGAADDQNVYYGAGGAGLAALRLATGEKVWSFAAASGNSAPTVIPGVVFQGANTRLVAVSTTDGKQLWEFNTAQEFTTVNKVPAHGGQISMGSAVIVDGMVFVSSGYAITSGNSGGNVLLAFSVQ